MTCTNNINGQSPMSLIISNNTSDLLAGFEIQFMNANSSNDLMLTTIMRFHHFFLVFFFFSFLLRVTSRLYGFSQALIVRLSKPWAALGIKTAEWHLLSLLLPSLFLCCLQRSLLTPFKLGGEEYWSPSCAHVLILSHQQREERLNIKLTG